MKIDDSLKGKQSCNMKIDHILMEEALATKVKRKQSIKRE